MICCNFESWENPPTWCMCIIGIFHWWDQTQPFGNFYTNCTTKQGGFLSPRQFFLNLGMFILLQNHTLRLGHLYSETFCTYSHTGERNNLEIIYFKKLRSNLQSLFIPLTGVPKGKKWTTKFSRYLSAYVQVWISFLNCLVQKCCCGIISNGQSLVLLADRRLIQL